MRVRQAKRLTSRCILSVRGGGGNHKGLERGGPLRHHGADPLEEAQYGMEVHENHGSSVPRRGRKRVGERGLRGAVQADQRILVK